MTVANADSTLPAVPPERPRLLRQRDAFPVAVAAQAVVIFALVGASVGLGIGTLFGLLPATLTRFLEGNFLDEGPRLQLFLNFVVGGAIAGAGALLYLVVRRRAGVASLRRAADIVLPLIVAGLVPSL